MKKKSCRLYAINIILPWVAVERKGQPMLRQKGLLCSVKCLIHHFCVPNVVNIVLPLITNSNSRGRK